MGLLDRLKAKKEAVESRKHLARANKLQKLKTERVKYEGRAKVINLERKEKMKLSKAKATVKEGNKNPLIKKFSENLKTNISKNSTNKRQRVRASKFKTGSSGLNPIFHSTGSSSSPFVTSGKKKKKGNNGEGIFW